ncbi:MAG: cyclic nucleotide-binding domain-containing protein [Burkholderiaceae bacterium]|jgi:hypothetical protein
MGKRDSRQHPVEVVLEDAGRRNHAVRSQTQQAAIDFERLICLVLGAEEVPAQWRPRLMAAAEPMPTQPAEALEPTDRPHRKLDATPTPASKPVSKPVATARPKEVEPPSPTATLDLEPTGTRVFSAGSIIFKQGDAANEFYVISEGTVCLFDPTAPQPVAELGPGETFGEQSILIGGVRSLSAQARTEVRAVCVRADGLRLALEQEPGLIRPVFESVLLQLYLQNDLTSRGHPVLP